MTLVKDTFITDQLNEIRETVSKGEFLPKPVLIKLIYLIAIELKDIRLLLKRMK